MGRSGRPLRGAAGFAVLAAAVALVVAMHGLREAPECTGGGRLCAEQLALLGSVVLSCWCGIASLRAGWFSSPPRPRVARRDALCDLPTALLLLRSLLCGIVVALLSWAAVRGHPHWLLMGAMQANSSIGAWLAYQLQRADDPRARSPPAVAQARGGALATPGRGCSRTLPRGWRYHKSSGLFEHKRTGRVQYEPPVTGDIGSPLASLPPCDEDRTYEDSALLDSDIASDKDSGCETRHGRSRTWNDGSRRTTSRTATRSSMNVWELHAALNHAEPTASHRRWDPRDAV